MSGNECFALTLGLGIVCLSCASSVKQGLFCKETSRVTKGGTRPIVTIDHACAYPVLDCPETSLNEGVLRVSVWCRVSNTDIPFIAYSFDFFCVELVVGMEVPDVDGAGAHSP